MFKFFRKYNKWLLAVGGSLLMIVFLLPVGMGGRGGGNPAKHVLGYALDAKVTQADLYRAVSEKRTLEQLSRLLRTGVEDDLVWVLIQRDAARLGLAVSQQEVNTILGMLGIDETALNNYSARSGTHPDFVRQSVAAWAVTQQYADLVSGRRIMPPAERLSRLVEVVRTEQEFSRQLRQLQEDKSPQAGVMQQYLLMQYQQVIGQLLDAAQASPRISEPMLERFVHDQRSQVKVTTVAVPASRYLPQAPQPGDEEIQALYEKHKDDLRGQSKPYGFGYRFPNRVKLEYLAIPFDRLLAKTQVDDIEALKFYNANKDQFTRTLPPREGETTPQTETIPYREVRQEIIDSLRQQRATTLGDRMAKEAQGLLLDNTRNLETKDGYKVIPGFDDVKIEDKTTGDATAVATTIATPVTPAPPASPVTAWEPIALEQAAQDLQANYGVLPDVVKRDGQWIEASELTNLSGIGLSRIITGPGNQNPPTFADYVLSARALKPKTDNVLVSYRLQVGMPSVPMRDAQGDIYLFRLTAAEPTRQPKNLEEVRLQVEYNAKQLAAYGLLLTERAQWADRLASQPLAEIANDVGSTLTTTEFFPRRSLTREGLAVPYIQGVGQSEAFVDAVFDLVERMEGDPSKAPLLQRSAAIAVPDRLSLSLTIIDDYRTVSRGQYQQTVASYPQLPAMILNTMLHEQNAGDPLSPKAIKARTHWKPEYTEKHEEDEADDKTAAK